MFLLRGVEVNWCDGIFESDSQRCDSHIEGNRRIQSTEKSVP